MPCLNSPGSLPLQRRGEPGVRSRSCSGRRDRVQALPQRLEFRDELRAALAQPASRGGSRLRSRGRFRPPCRRSRWSRCSPRAEPRQDLRRQRFRCREVHVVPMLTPGLRTVHAAARILPLILHVEPAVGVERRRVNELHRVAGEPVVQPLRDVTHARRAVCPDIKSRRRTVAVDQAAMVTSCPGTEGARDGEGAGPRVVIDDPQQLSPDRPDANARLHFGAPRGAAAARRRVERAPAASPPAPTCLGPVRSPRRRFARARCEPGHRSDASSGVAARQTPTSFD